MASERACSTASSATKAPASASSASPSAVMGNVATSRPWAAAASFTLAASASVPQATARAPESVRMCSTWWTAEVS